MKFLLVVTYLSYQGAVSVKTYDMPTMSECSKGGQAIQANVKAGRVAFNCWRV